MPGRKWYAVSAIVLVGGLVVAGLVLFSRLKGLGDELRQVMMPGEAELSLDRSGTYTIFHEHESIVEGRYYSSPEAIAGLAVRMTSGASGAPVELRAPPVRATYSFGGRSGVSIFSFEIDRPGSYRISAGYPDARTEPRIVLTIGRGFVGGLVKTILGTIGIAFGTLAISGTFAVVTFVKRRQARRQAAGTP